MTNQKLIQFKKELWDTCLQNQLFQNIPNDKIDKVTNVIDNICSNYQTQILQSNNDAQLIQVIHQEIRVQLSSLIEYQSSVEQNNSLRIDSLFGAKQNEYENSFRPKQPDKIDFSDKTDAPLDEDKLEALLQEQIQQRNIEVVDSTKPSIKKESKENTENAEHGENGDYKKSVSVDNSIQNEVIAMNPASSRINTGNIGNSPISITQVKSDEIDLNDLYQMVNRQNQIIQKLLKSHIDLLNYLHTKK